MPAGRRTGTVPPVRSGWRARWAVPVAVLAAIAALSLPLAPPAAAAPAAGQYVPVPPATVVNNVSVAAGATTTVTVTGANWVPAAANVAAVAVNVIANQPAGSGHLQLFPAGARPAADSTLNYQQGRTTASFEVVKVSASGQISVSRPPRPRSWSACAATTPARPRP